MPTRSLESAGASGAALDVLRQRPQAGLPCTSRARAQSTKRAAVLSTVVPQWGILPDSLQRSCVTVTTSDALSGGLSAGMQGIALPLRLKVGEGLTVSTNYRKDGKRTLNSRGLSAFGALFLQWPCHVLARFYKTQRLRLMASENRIAQCSLCFKAPRPTSVSPSIMKPGPRVCKTKACSHSI